MAKNSLYGFGRGLPERDQYHAFTREIQKASDRASAILATNHLDHILQESILNALPKRGDNPAAEKLFGGDTSILSSLNAKIRMAHALRIFGDATFKNLDTIRQVRNIFAHTAHPVSFRTPEIAKACKTLSRLPHVYRLESSSFRSARGRFTATVLEASQTMFFHSIIGFTADSERDGWVVPMP